MSKKSVDLSVTGTLFRIIFLYRSVAGQALVSCLVAEFFISPIFSQLLAKAVNQIKLVCTACDRILAIERLHTLTARTDECFNTYKSQERKNRVRRDHSLAPRLDTLISYQLSTDKPDVEVSRIHIKTKTQQHAQAVCERSSTHCRTANESALRGASAQLYRNSSRQQPLYGNYGIWKLNLSPLVKKHRRVRAGTTFLIQRRRRACLVTHIP